MGELQDGKAKSGKAQKQKGSERVVHDPVAEGVQVSTRQIEGENQTVLHDGGAIGSGCSSEVERGQRSGHVYLMGILDGCHKIGKTNNPERRVCELGAMLPIALQVVHLIATEAMDWLESYLHVAFAHCRVRGEWFRLSDAELDQLRRITEASSVKDLPAELVSLHAQNFKEAESKIAEPRLPKSSIPSDREEPRISIATILNAARGDRSINEIAIAADMTFSVVYNIFKGETTDPRYFTVAKLLAAMGKDFEWLESHWE